MPLQPEEVSIDEVKHTILAHKSVLTLHDLHIWTITSSVHTLSCHVIVDGDMRITQASKLIHELEHSLQDLKINHATIQVESAEHPHNLPDAVTCNLSEVRSITGGHIGHKH